MRKIHVFLSSAFRSVNYGADDYVKTLVGEDLTADIALALAEKALETREICMLNSLIDDANVIVPGPKWRIDRVPDQTWVPEAVLSVYRPATVTECDDDMEYERNLPPWIVIRVMAV